MRDKTITRALRCNFDASSMAEIAKKLASEVTEIQTIEEEKKVSNSAYKSRIDAHTEEMNSLASRYNKGHELKDIECDIRYNDPESGKKTIYRMDTAEPVETLEMSWEEKQDELQLNILPADEPTPDAVDDALKGLEDSPENPDEQADGAGA